MKTPHVLLALGFAMSAAQAAPAPSLDLALAYYSKVVTPEGVTREARYQERMLRRPGHVWSGRVLPALPAVAAAPGTHAEFNPVMLPRHVVMEHGKVRLEYVDQRQRELVAIPAAEYGNVSFDGSWENAWYLLDPKRVQALPVTSRVSPVAGAQWREREKDGVYERVLWDDKRQVALRLESGDLAGTVVKRIDVTVLEGLSAKLPWQQLSGYTHKEYADFLD
ncbi:MAG: hypothetical protein ACJ8GW_11870 [Massilia sp.]